MWPLWTVFIEVSSSRATYSDVCGGRPTPAMNFLELLDINRDSLILDDLDIAQKVFLGSSTSRVSSFHSSAVASPGSQLGYLTDELTGNDGRDLVTYKAGPLAIH